MTIFSSSFLRNRKSIFTEQNNFHQMNKNPPVMHQISPNTWPLNIRSLKQRNEINLRWMDRSYYFSRKEQKRPCRKRRGRLTKREDGADDGRRALCAETAAKRGLRWSLRRRYAKPADRVTATASGEQSHFCPASRFAAARSVIVVTRLKLQFRKYIYYVFHFYIALQCCSVICE